METVHLTIPATFGYEDIPTNVVETWVTKMGANKEKADKAKLAVMEICLNAIEHGCGNDPIQTVAIDLSQQSDTLTVEISDSGKGFTPTVPKKFPPTQANRRGFGIFMAHKLTDKLEFSSSAKGTLVRITIKVETCKIH